MTKHEIKVGVNNLEDIKFIYELLDDLGEIHDDISKSGSGDRMICVNRRPGRDKCWSSFSSDFSRFDTLQKISIAELIELLKNENI